jgi:hypothetical protein
MRLRLQALAVAAVAATLTAGLTTGSANASPVKSATFSATQQAKAIAYWTPARMTAATDLDALPAAPAHARPGAVHPKDTSPQAWTGGGLISTTAGKVFFHNPEDNGDYACSGDAVNSDNRAVVATAGHCVVDTNGTSYTNWVFIPAYNHGNRPFGTFAATSLHWESQRINDSDAAWDAAFATMGTVNGGTLVDTVGGEGIGFDQTPGQLVYSFGYGGSDAEGNGEQMNWCSGTEINPGGHEGGGVWGIDCVQTGGSSGGPFLANFDPGNGQGMQIGNISISAGSYEYHPYYGWEAEDAYNAAQSS